MNRTRLQTYLFLREGYSAFVFYDSNTEQEERNFNTRSDRESKTGTTVSVTAHTASVNICNIVSPKQQNCD